MVCHSCGKAVEPGQRFCGNCGASLQGITDATEVIAATEPTEQWAADDPVWARTGTVPTSPPPAVDPEIVEATPATAWPLDAITAAPDTTDPVWAQTSETYHPADVGPATTAQMPAVPVPIAPPRPRVRFGAVSVFSLLAALAVLLGAFTVAVSVESDVRLTLTDQTPPTFRTGTWMLDDLGDNLSIAVLIGALVMVAGGVAAAFGWKWGSGLAGGGGLGTAGVAALALGLAQYPLQTAREFAAVPNQQKFVLTLTRDIGYWLLVVALALGIVVFFASLVDAFGDRRAGLNPWIAALGALATVIAVIGPMLPAGQAIFSDNWYVIPGTGNPPSALVAARLAQLGLLLVSGVIGYLSVRRWGLGLAVGGALPIVWLAVSTLFGFTSNPVGPGYRNPGASSSDLHGVTIIGVSAIIAMAILAAVAAYDQTSRERI